jgi:hypothetical protein
MEHLRRSLIDNWSLEHAGILLGRDSDVSAIPRDKFILNLGGLSNYIHALLFYDETNFLSNGFEKDWTKFHWFEKNTKLHVKGLSAQELDIDWNSEESYTDQGISNYLKSSDRLELDLFVSPERATMLNEHILKKSPSNLESVLKKVDEKITSEAQSLWIKEAQFGIIDNFKFPCLTQYVLSESSSVDDLLNVIIGIKDSRRVKYVMDELAEISSSTKASAKFQTEVENRIKRAFGDKSKSDTSLTLKISAWFFSLNKTINVNFFSRKEHLLFLKDIVACRTESGNLKKSIKRIFRQSL